jgi:beta-glucosidase
MHEDTKATTSTPDRLDTLVDQLTLAEQVALLAGAAFWTTVPIPRLNIPALKVTDGPAGARGGGPLVGGTQTAAFPVGIALGATWNVDLLREVGRALAQEARDKGAGVLLAPTVNLFRSTLNGRNFEGNAEDPFLAGKLGVAYIRGLQAEGVAATVKHYAGNESEYQRFTISSDIPERALRELYLLPFEMAVKDGGAWAVMSAYNQLNGTYCSEHKRLLTDMLRDEWGFDGLVMSDWGGTHSAGESVRAGLDLEMPGPAQARADLLADAEADAATRAAVRVAARNVLRLMERTGILDSPRDVRVEAESGIEHPETTALIRRAGTEGIVLLKNEAGTRSRVLLPVPMEATVAVVGPNAATGQVMGGGSAQINAHRRISPLEGLRSALGDAQVSYALGCYNDKFLPVSTATMHIEYRAAEGEAVLAQESRPQGEVMWFDLPAGVPPQFRARLTSTLTIAEAGHYELSLASAGLSRLMVDGEELVENWTNYRPGGTYGGLGSDEARIRHVLEAGEHPVIIEFASQHDAVIPLSAVRFGFRQELPESSVEDAARLAAEADYAVVCIGTNGDWETEGVDRWGLALPGRQDELVREVARANPNTIVLLQTGGPVLMRWLDEVPAVVQAWFPGQEAGYAIADVLLGRAEPGGRLPQTFPARLEDDPVHPEQPDRQYPGEDGHVEYREGLYIGYRHVDRAGLTPLFPFGFGLSYTTFKLGEPRLRADTVEPGDEIAVTIPVRNMGERAGQTVIQLYVRDVEARLDRPSKELKAFAKVTLQPDEAQDVTLTLDMRALAYYDETRQAWVADAGDFDLLIGASSADLPRAARVTLTGEWTQTTTGFRRQG